MNYVGQRIFKVLFEIIRLDVRRCTATLLYPDYRSVKECANDERAACFNYIREQLKSIAKSNSDYYNEARKKKPNTNIPLS